MGNGLSIIKYVCSFIIDNKPLFDTSRRSIFFSRVAQVRQLMEKKNQGTQLGHRSKRWPPFGLEPLPHSICSPEFQTKPYLVLVYIPAAAEEREDGASRINKEVSIENSCLTLYSPARRLLLSSFPSSSMINIYRKGLCS